jgi:hypothetical protein
MGRQTRSLRVVEEKFRPLVTRGSSTSATIPNNGVVVLSTSYATDYTLDNPVQGCRVVLYNSEATTGVLVRVNPKGSTVSSIGASTVVYFIEFDGAGDKSVTLEGINSTGWIVSAITPVSTALNLAASS